MTLMQARCVLSDGKAPKFPGAKSKWNGMAELRSHLEEQKQAYEADPFAFPGSRRMGKPD